MRPASNRLRCLLPVLLVGMNTRAFAGGDAAEGKDVFESECSACHAVEAGRIKLGPSVAGVVDRKAGCAAGFAYSDALKHSGIIWNNQELDAWITNPQKKLPGVRMTYPGQPDAAERESLIAYLKTLN